MSLTITEEFVQQYTRGIDLLVQQKGSRFRDAVRLEMVGPGKQAFFDQIAATAAIKRTTRHGDTPILNTPHQRRMVPMQDYEWADLIDDADKLKILNDPTNSYSQNAAHAMSRAIDDEVISAALGIAATGETGTGTQAADAALFTGAVTVSTAGAFALTDVLEQMKLAENDTDEPWYIAIPAKVEKDLIEDAGSSININSRDFTSMQIAQTGELNRILGFNVIRTERLNQTAGAAQWRCFAWRKSAITLAIAKDSTGRISERADKSYSNQVYYSMSIGAVRMEEAGVVEFAVTV